MNPTLNTLHPYPFEKLRGLLHGITANSSYAPINLSIGEPKHATPRLVTQALTEHLDGLANYPTTLGMDALRQAIADWAVRRYGLKQLDPATQIIPVNGSREALFAFAQAVVDRSQPAPVVISPNPFYQIYEGAALLAGATPHYVNLRADQQFAFSLNEVPRAVLARTQLVYVCSPNNPTGSVLQLDDWKTLFELADTYGFVLASDECYSEIYLDEQNPPLGALQAAQQLGRHDYRGLVVFSSLSKRSNVPGMRSGFVAGDAALLHKFLLYRTYHGCAMNPAIQHASIAAWKDEQHVQDNRRQYRDKFRGMQPILSQVLDAPMPDAGFYLWAGTPVDDTEFVRELYRQFHVTVLPGSFLARDVEGSNPGSRRLRIALVASQSECMEAAARICEFSKRL